MRYLEIAEYVRPEAHGAPDFLVERSLREAAIEFCVKTDIYRPEPEDFLVIPIHNCSHWCSMIVCYPNKLLEQFEAQAQKMEEEKQEESQNEKQDTAKDLKKPRLLYLDSMGI